MNENWPGSASDGGIVVTVKNSNLMLVDVWVFRIPYPGMVVVRCTVYSAPDGCGVNQETL